METELRLGYLGTARRKARQQTSRSYRHRATSRLYRGRVKTQKKRFAEKYFPLQINISTRTWRSVLLIMKLVAENIVLSHFGKATLRFHTTSVESGQMGAAWESVRNYRYTGPSRHRCWGTACGQTKDKLYPFIECRLG